MDALLPALQWVADWFGGDAASDGIGGFFRQWWTWALSKLTEWYIRAKIEALQFAWSVAQSVLEDLALGTKINESLALLPSNVREALNFFKVPEAMTNIITAGVTRLVMRLTPGL